MLLGVSLCKIYVTSESMLITSVIVALMHFIFPVLLEIVGKLNDYCK